LNNLLKTEPALHENQFNQDGFEWVDLNHRQESVVVFKRKGKKKADDLLVILNMTPVVRQDWEIHTAGKAYKKEVFNSDEKAYWGTGNVFNPDLRCELVDKSQKMYRLRVNLPPLAGIILK
jgi:1,4-alpha-glucan branching enzyme